MPYRDPNRQKEYQREYQRKRRSQVLADSDKPTLEFKIETLEDLRQVLAQITFEVMSADLDLGVKGRVIAQLLTVGVRVLEKTDLEQRVERLEERAERDKYR